MDLSSILSLSVAPNIGYTWNHHEKSSKRRYFSDTCLFRGGTVPKFTLCKGSLHPLGRLRTRSLQTVITQVDLTDCDIDSAAFSLLLRHPLRALQLYFEPDGDSGTYVRDESSRTCVSAYILC